MAGLSLLACTVAPHASGQGATAATPATLPPVEAFFDRPKYDSMSLSPDGKLLAAGVPGNGHRNLALVDIESGSVKFLTGFDDEDLAGYSWIGDRLIQLQSGNLQDASGLRSIRQNVVVDTNGRLVRDMRPKGYIRMASRIIRRMNDAGDDLIVENNDRSPTGLDAWRYNPRTDRRELLTIDNPGNVARYLADRSGQVRVAVTIDPGGLRQGFYYRKDASGPWTKILDEPSDKVSMEPVAFDFDGRTLYVDVIDVEHGGHESLFAYDPESRTLGTRLYESREIDTDGLIFDEVRRVLVGVRDDSPAGVTWIDPEWKRLQDSIDAALPKTRNHLQPARHQPMRVLVMTESETQPPVYFLLDRQTHQMQQVAEAFPALKEADLSPRAFIHYRARDGLSIPAYLTMPKRPAGARPPLIVNIHGGPYVPRHSFGYDADAQFFASRGYAVLEPDFRGTQGYGTAFEQAGWKQWGLAMQDDVTDGVKALVAEGKVDPDRVCLFGASYGGYATLWGLEKEPRMFRCGVAFVAVSDLELMFDVGWSDTNRGDRYGAANNYFKRTIGDPGSKSNRAALREVSPLYHADRLEAPLLLAYGAADQRVPLTHGNQMRSALDKYRKPYEWVVYDDEGHGFTKDENRYDFYRRVDAFLAKNLAPRAKGEAGP